MESHEIGSDIRMTARKGAVRRAARYAGGVVLASVVVAALIADWGVGLIHILASLPTVLLGAFYLLAGLGRGDGEVSNAGAGGIWLGAGLGALATVALQTFILGTVFGWRSSGEPFDFGGFVWPLHLQFSIPTLLAAAGCLVYGLVVLRRRRQRAAGAEGGV